MKKQEEKPKQEPEEKEEIKCQEFPKYKWNTPFGILNHREKKIRSM